MVSILWLMMIHNNLVGGTPLKNDGVRQLGWWHSQLIWKVIKFMFQTTNRCLYVFFSEVAPHEDEHHPPAPGPRASALFSPRPSRCAGDRRHSRRCPANRWRIWRSSFGKTTLKKPFKNYPIMGCLMIFAFQNCFFCVRRNNLGWLWIGFVTLLDDFQWFLDYAWRILEFWCWVQ